jgi:citrate synthase
MNEFKPGLEGVVAFQTEIAEPDREGGALRYRGVNIEELVGSYHYEQIWGLLVDESFTPGMPDPEPYEPAALSGNAPSDLQAETARLSNVWGLSKLVDISPEEARDDLARLSAEMMEIVARSAAVHDGREPAPDDVVAQGESAAEKFLLRWRGEADPDHVRAIDTYWICTAEHGLNASTFTARITASTGADCGAAMSAAVGALSGPLHGGAPARVLPMLDEVERTEDPHSYVKDILGTHGRIMGFGHRVYRAEDPRSRILKQTARELGSPRYEVAEALEEAALAALREHKPDYVIATNVEFYSAVVLDLADVPPDLTPAMFACARVAGWSAHILEEKRTGRLIRPSARYIGPPSRPVSEVGGAPVPG